MVGGPGMNVLVCKRFAGLRRFRTTSRVSDCFGELKQEIYVLYKYLCKNCEIR